MLGLPLDQAISWIVWLAFLAGLALAGVVAFTGSLVGLRCARCGYELERHDAPCPECGRQPDYATDPWKRFRPWALLPLAVLCVAPAPVWTIWDDDLLALWYRLMHREWKTASEATSAGLTIRILEGNRPSNQGRIACEVLRNTRRVALLTHDASGPASGLPWSACRFPDAAPAPGLADLTGDNIDEIILFARSDESDTWSCLVFDPTRGDAPLAHARLHDPAVVASTETNPAYLLVWDTTLVAWRGRPGDDWLLPIALVWNGTRLAAEPALTSRAQGLDAHTVASLTRELAQRDLRSADEPIHPAGWRTLAALHMAGRDIEARELFAILWRSPERVAGPRSPSPSLTRGNPWSRDEAMRRFIDRVRTSPWWPDLREP